MQKRYRCFIGLFTVVLSLLLASATAANDGSGTSSADNKDKKLEQIIDEVLLVQCKQHKGLCEQISACRSGTVPALRKGQTISAGANYLFPFKGSARKNDYLALLVQTDDSETKISGFHIFPENAAEARHVAAYVAQLHRGVQDKSNPMHSTIEGAPQWLPFVKAQNIGRSLYYLTKDEELFLRQSKNGLCLFMAGLYVPKRDSFDRGVRFGLLPFPPKD